MSASNSAVTAAAREQHLEPWSRQHALDCGGEPCDAVARGLRAFFDRRLHGLDANGRSCADCHMADRPFPALARQRRGAVPVAPAAASLESERRRPAVPADRRRRFPDSTASDASDFSNLRQNGLVRIVFPLPPTMRLIDPATNLPSSETFVDVWRMVPTVNDVALTGPDGVNPWPRGPNHFGGYQLDARLATLQEQALGALTNHAQVQNAPPQRILDDLASFQRVLFTNHRVRALADAVARRHDAAAGSRSAAQRARAAGQGGVRRAPARIATAAPASRRRRRRSPDSTTSRPSVRVRSIPSTPPRFAFAAVPAQPRAQRADLRDHVDQRHDDPAHELRSRPRAC